MTSERKSAFILGGIAVIECGWVIWNLRLNGWRLFRYLGFAPGLAGAIPGWIAAALVVIIFVGFSLRLPSVRANLFRPSFLKFLAVLVAIGAGILEEVMFRRWTMNWLMAHGYGLMGRSVDVAAGAMLATGCLGLMLGIVYLLSGRSLAPCIVAHFLINLAIEPGLVLAATRGEMSSHL